MAYNDSWRAPVHGINRRPHSPIGRGSRLKIGTVWVRIPLGALLFIALRYTSGRLVATKIGSARKGPGPVLILLRAWEVDVPGATAKEFETYAK